MQASLEAEAKGKAEAMRIKSHIKFHMNGISFKKSSVFKDHLDHHIAFSGYNRK
jgi:hypothetical protein